jgi:integrase
MARRVRASTIDNRTARLKLEPRGKPYAFTIISRGIAIGYRRNKGAGSWVLRAADGHGAYWTDVVGIADDFEEADGEQIFDWYQASDRARALVRGKDAGAKPVTVGEALDVYAADLVTRGGGAGNASYPRTLLPSALLNRPVPLLTSVELRRWRDGLLGQRKPATVNRLVKGLRAALNLALAHDSRIGNAQAWKVGLASLRDAHEPRHIILPEADVRRLVAAAYSIGSSMGLWVEVLAVTGARPSQVARLDVVDLQHDRPDPRVMMPSSRKGSGVKRISRSPVPVPATLAAKLKAAALGRALHAPLLTRADGSRWGRHAKAFAAVAEKAGLPGTVAYSLRHSHITRSLLAGVPVRVIASLCDTSITMIEQSYSAFISSHADTVARANLLDLSDG